MIIHPRPHFGKRSEKTLPFILFTFIVDLLRRFQIIAKYDLKQSNKGPNGNTV